MCYNLLSDFGRRRLWAFNWRKYPMICRRCHDDLSQLGYRNGHVRHVYALVLTRDPGLRRGGPGTGRYQAGEPPVGASPAPESLGLAEEPTV